MTQNRTAGPSDLRSHHRAISRHHLSQVEAVTRRQRHYRRQRRRHCQIYCQKRGGEGDVTGQATLRGARGDSSDCVSYEMSGRNGLMFEKSETSPSA
jgi:hypothetical protein